MSKLNLAIREPAQLEERDGKPSKITGYAAVFYDGTPSTEYRLAEGYIERLFPGAFDRCIRERQDVRALFNHDSNMVLGRCSSGTLRLSVDNRGLRYEIDPPDSRKDVSEAIKRNDVDGSSFSFSLGARDDGHSYRMDGNTRVREIRDIQAVYDVGPVTFPAYSGTTAMCRSIDPAEAMKELQAWEASEAERIASEARAAKAAELSEAMKARVAKLEERFAAK